MVARQYLVFDTVNVTSKGKDITGSEKKQLLKIPVRAKLEHHHL
jgi:hypothetical protein